MNRFNKRRPPKFKPVIQNSPIKSIGPLAAARLDAAIARKQEADARSQAFAQQIAAICREHGLDFQGVMTGKIGIDGVTGNITTAEDVKKQLQEQLAKVEAAAVAESNGKPAA